MFVEQVTQIRKDIDYYMMLCRKLQSSREMSIVITSMEKSRMWFGKYLEMMDQESPYAIKDGNRKTKEDILPETDKSVRELKDVSLINEIQEIDSLREWLKYQCQFFTDHWFDFMKNGDENQEIGFKTDDLTIIYAIIMNLTEARMYLGKVLNDIKQQS